MENNKNIKINWRRTIEKQAASIALLVILIGSGVIMAHTAAATIDNLGAFDEILIMALGMFYKTAKIYVSLMGFVLAYDLMLYSITKFSPNVLPVKLLLRFVEVQEDDRTE